MPGSLFKQGTSKKVTNVVSGVHQNYPVKFFYYEYMTGSRKDSQQFEYTVAEITFLDILPNIAVKGFKVIRTWPLLPGQKKLSMGYAFDKRFSVYVPEDFEIEAFQIFTPDVMEDFISKASFINFEFIGTKLYVVENHYITNARDLTRFFEIVKYLLEKVAPRLMRLSRDVRAMQEAIKS